MKLSDEFRENARACLALSRKADSLESQGHWVVMAQYWFDLAVQAEDRKVAEGLDPGAREQNQNRPLRKSN